MKMKLERRLCLGCGEALRPLAVAALPRRGGIVPILARTTAKVAMGALKKR